MKKRITSSTEQKPAAKDDIKQFLQKVRDTPLTVATGQQGRLIFTVDATMSRQALWDQSHQLHGEMFSEAAGQGGLDLQFVYYRGFRDFYHYSWMNQAEPLLKEMQRLTCAAGATQIIRILDHIRYETRRQHVNAGVFVGDAMEENPSELCALAGELAILKTPLFVFQEGFDPVAQHTFKEMARISGGAYCAFDSGSVAQLRELLGAVAVYAGGGYKALKNYSLSGSRRLSELTGQLPHSKE